MYQVILLTRILAVRVLTGEQCTKGFMELTTLTERARYIGVRDRLLDNETRVLEEYQFNCSSTNITSVILGIDVKLPSNSRNRYPSIQLWRPQTGSSDQYELVPDSERVIYYSTSNTSTSGVFEYPLNPPISVNNGDLLAVSQPNQGDSIVRVYYIGGVNSRSYRLSFGRTTASLNTSPITNQLILIYPITGNTIY